MEIWKDVVGYEGYYQVSSEGNVRSVDREIPHNRFGKIKRKGRPLAVSANQTGYSYVFLTMLGVERNVRVHRLVAEAFIPNPDNLPHVNHKDENKTNNCVENLEWCTAEYNTNYGTHNERMANSKHRPVLCVELGKVFECFKEAERQTHICSSSISDCCRGKPHCHTAGGYHWEYYEKETD